MDKKSMIITRTPMRISYVGGGSDFLEHIKKGYGSVIGSTINQYIYVFSSELSEVASEKIRFTYRETESVNEIEAIKHPVLRAMLQEFNWNSRINVGTFSALPAGVGLGGSSAFTVGLANMLCHLKGQVLGSEELAKLAIKIEREVLGEQGGIQDQYHSAIGGFRRYRFEQDKTSISENILTNESIELLNKQQMLVWVGSPRNSANYASSTVKATKSSKLSFIEASAELSEDLYSKLIKERDCTQQFRLLAEAVNLGWKLKQEFTAETTSEVLRIVKLGMQNGAKAAKLCGAGGSGFVLFLYEPENETSLKLAFSRNTVLYPKINLIGSEVLFNDNEI